MLLSYHFTFPNHSLTHLFPLLFQNDDKGETILYSLPIRQTQADEPLHSKHFQIEKPGDFEERSDIYISLQQQRQQQSEGPELALPQISLIASPATVSGGQESTSISSVLMSESNKGDFNKASNDKDGSDDGDDNKKEKIVAGVDVGKKERGGKKKKGYDQYNSDSQSIVNTPAQSDRPVVNNLPKFDDLLSISSLRSYYTDSYQHGQKFDEMSLQGSGLEVYIPQQPQEEEENIALLPNLSFVDQSLSNINSISMGRSEQGVANAGGLDERKDIEQMQLVADTQAVCQHGGNEDLSWKIKDLARSKDAVDHLDLQMAMGNDHHWLSDNPLPLIGSDVTEMMTSSSSRGDNHCGRKGYSLLDKKPPNLILDISGKNMPSQPHLTNSSSSGSACTSAYEIQQKEFNGLYYSITRMFL